MRSKWIRLSILLSILCLLPLASDVGAQGTPISGVSFVDARGKPRFKVGDWVKYRFNSHSDDGTSQEYDLVVLISGEEVFWGEPCFWVETHTGFGGHKPTVSDAKLMSYAMFGDTLWEQRIAVYQRKFATFNSEDGSIKQELLHRSLQKRPSGQMAPVTTVLVDTLGREAVTVPRGTFQSTKVRLKSGIGQTEDIGDSTRRTENWDVRTRYLSAQVPVTSIVKEVNEQWITRKTWKLGKSQDAVQNYLARGVGTMELVAWGNGGTVRAEMTPLYARKPLAKRPVIVPRMPEPRKSKVAAAGD